MSRAEPVRPAAVAASPGMRRALGVIGEPVDGVGYVRFVQPFSRLGQAGWSLRTLGGELTLERRGATWRPSDELLDDVALVLFPQMVASPVLDDGARVELVAPIVETARRRGIPVVHSIDDWLPAIDAVNPGTETIDTGELARLLGEADAFIVTTSALERSLAPRGRPVELLPNAVDPAAWRPRPRRGGELRVGWAGSSSHLDDLLFIVPAIAELRRRRTVTFVVFGLVDRSLDEQLSEIRRARSGFTPAQRERAERFVEVVARLRELGARHVPFVDMARYPATLTALDLDLGLCPLLDTPFNRHKSALKAYEYAACGTMALASRVEPYRDEPLATVDNDEAAWVEELERWLADPDAREREHARQLDFVREERSIDRLAPRWAATLDRLAVPATAATRHS